MEGPLLFENWKACTSGSPVLSTLEYPLFTDAHIVGGNTEQQSPYQLINTISGAFVNARVFRPAVILRIDIHLTRNLDTPMNKTDDGHYHGGEIEDEIAALVSLSMGIRLKAGGYIRQFSPNGDSKGQPIYLGYKDDPTLPTKKQRPIVPGALGTHPLDDAQSLLNIRFMRPEDVVPLIRAARLYQDGLWIAESEPSLSWLMFVSAIETAASHWSMIEESPIERLRASRPTLEKILHSYGGEELALKVAEEIAPYMGATKKFTNFVLKFIPDPPATRPITWAQHSFDAKPLEKTLKQIYKYRSRALHGGTPFPAPMSDPPFPTPNDGVLAEIPLGLAASTQGGTWLAKDMPILLHTFEYITRQTLLKWWHSLVDLKEDRSDERELTPHV